jgi:transposase
MDERKQYTREFKSEAVRLLDQSARPASEIARQLGIKRTVLYRWRDAVRTKGDAAFGGSGRRLNTPEDELMRLRRELALVQEERDLLKKAAAYFAKALG